MPFLARVFTSGRLGVYGFMFRAAHTVHNTRTQRSQTKTPVDSVTHAEGGGSRHTRCDALRAHTLAHSHRRVPDPVRGSGRQIINSRLNNTLYTSKAQALHTWMDPYLRCGTLRYTPRYRAH